MTGNGSDEVEGERMATAEQAAAARLEEARAVLADRAEEARQGLTERAGPVLAERAEQARGGLQRRWHELEQEVPVDLDTVVPQLERGLWQVIRAVLGVLLLVPRLLVRALGGLGTLADDVSERGLVVGERAREIAASVPPSRRERRRRRWRTAAWTGAGFGVGLFVGWLVGRRDQAMVTYEPAELGAHLETAPVPPGPVAAPLDTTDEQPPVSVAEQEASPEEDEPVDAIETAPVPPGPVAAPLDTEDHQPGEPAEDVGDGPGHGTEEEDQR